MTRFEDFAKAYDEHIWDVYGFFGYRLASRETAEDLTQATFVRALRAWDRYDPARASRRTWLLAIARNLLIDHFRREGGVRTEPLPEEGARADVLGVEPPIDDDLGLSPELERALSSLEEREREVVALRYGADLTGAEVAELTGLSEANVHQIASRSLRRLRAALESPPD